MFNFKYFHMTYSQNIFSNPSLVIEILFVMNNVLSIILICSMNINILKRLFYMETYVV